MAQNKKKVAVAAPKARKPKRDAEEKKFAKKADMTEFRAQLDSLGLKIIEVSADGNCFFRAMGDQLEGNEEEHMKYRAMIVQYIKEHRVDFEPFIEDEEPFEKYCDSMLEDGTWAGHMELQAASILTRKNICIHMGEHYNSVRLREDPCQGPAMPVIIKGKSKTKECSCGSARKHKPSCNLATTVASREPPKTTAPSREPPKTKGGQGKGQKGKKQKKKEQDETPAIRDHDSKVAPDLGALCI
uniref:OTU domain-containing protein n=1 Tax=Oryza nivara TaxID=4536 RepID=A0A0E0H786_ORYNI